MDKKAKQIDAQKVPAGFKLQHTLRGHKASIYRFAWSPNGLSLATPSEDGTIRLWDTVGGHLHRTIESHSNRPRCVAWSPDGHLLASGSHDGTVRLWLAETGESLRTLKGHAGTILSTAWSPDGRTLASASHDQTIRLWDAQRFVTEGKEPRSSRILEGHAGGVRSRSSRAT